MGRLFPAVGWSAFGLLGLFSLIIVSINRGESINSLWLLTGGLCTCVLSYRFYSKWIATKVLMLDETRRTPAEAKEDGKDFVPTHKWVVFGHHFAAIAGPGPLVGPVLASQFGYLPGTLWLLMGATLGGAVHDMVVMFCSMRRGGKNLSQMVRDEIGPLAGMVAFVSVLSILVIVIAVLSFVVAKALAHSPWSLFTVAATIPLALAMGGTLRILGPDKLPWVTGAGIFGLFAVVVAGQYVSLHEPWRTWFTVGAPGMAWILILYGLAVSSLPIWLLVTPHGYLCSFMKIGTVAVLGMAIIFLAPALHMPALTSFIDGTGPVMAGPVFPFCFITIACGAISGFHALVASGTSSKITQRESSIRFIGYGAMVTETMVALMALIAACALDPGVYFCINVTGEPQEVVQKMTAQGFPVTDATMRNLARELGEETMYGRTGGAPTFAVGMAQMFSQVSKKIFGSSEAIALWYHFAIMFEALFILTTIDTGTRVGRFLCQDLLGVRWKTLGSQGGYFSNLICSLLFVAAWGWFLIQGVNDPNGISTLWAIFGIANQLLAVIALAFGATILVKMGRARYSWICWMPLIWIFAVTMTAGWMKIFHADPRIGFITQIEVLRAKMAGGSLTAANGTPLSTLVFNYQVDIALTALFLLLVIVIVGRCGWECYVILTGRKKAVLLEEDFGHIKPQPGS